MDHKSVHSAGYSSQAQMQNRDNVIHQGVGISLPYCTAVEETADKISLLHRIRLLLASSQPCSVMHPKFEHAVMP